MRPRTVVDCKTELNIKGLLRVGAGMMSLQVTSVAVQVKRRARDSNPGGTSLPLAVFKTAAIGH
jgi:hypothetical protein